MIDISKIESIKSSFEVVVNVEMLHIVTIKLFVLNKCPDDIVLGQDFISYFDVLIFGNKRKLMEMRKCITTLCIVSGQQNESIIEVHENVTKNCRKSNQFLTLQEKSEKSDMVVKRQLCTEVQN